MFARIRKAQEKEGGFTLIELLVVMIIIGILAAIAIPVFLSQKDKAKQASAKSDVHVLATNAETALTDGTPTAFALAADGTITYTSAGTAQTVGARLSPGNTASGYMDTDGTYCVSVTSVSTTNPTWSIADGQLTNGACPTNPGTALPAS